MVKLDWQRDCGQILLTLNLEYTSLLLRCLQDPASIIGHCFSQTTVTFSFHLERVWTRPSKGSITSYILGNKVVPLRFWRGAEMCSFMLNTWSEFSALDVGRTWYQHCGGPALPYLLLGSLLEMCLQQESVLSKGIKEGHPFKISEQPLTFKVICNKAKNLFTWALKNGYP